MFYIFKQPTPLYSDVKKNLIRYFGVGCFIAFFLIIFQPFGTASGSKWHTKIYKRFTLRDFVDYSDSERNYRKFKCRIE